MHPVQKIRREDLARSDKNRRLRNLTVNHCARFLKDLMSDFFDLGTKIFSIFSGFDLPTAHRVKLIYGF